MFNVIVRISGKSGVKETQASDIASLKSQLDLGNYTATINGEPANSDSELFDDAVVNFTQAVKGGK